MGRPRHIVVVGAGFGGLTLVRRLAGRRPRSRDLAVTWVDRHNHHTFQPLLYQVATAGLQPQDIGVPIRAIARRLPGVTVRVGEVVAIEPQVREVRLADGGSLHYDHLVLATGAISEDFDVPGVAEHAHGLKTLADATTLRNHLLGCFEHASVGDPVPDGLLTFVVAGGGPTGVEVAGALAELVALVLRRDHPELDVGQVRIVLVELADRLLAGFAPTSSRAALRALERRGVEVLLGTGIGRAAADHVELTTDGTITTRTLIWAAGVGASPLASCLGVPLERGGRVPVDAWLRVQGLDGVHAIGDVAAARQDGLLLPQIAPVAIQQARHVAEQLRGDPAATRPFRYRDKGIMATIGRNTAVAELPGRVRLRGFVAWLAWLLLHLVMLVGFKNRVGVLLSWIWNYLFRDHAARLILEQREAETAETRRGRVRRQWASGERSG